MTDDAGRNTIYTTPGIPAIEVIADGNVSADLEQPTVLIGLDGSTLSNVNSQSIAIELGDQVSIYTTANASPITILGSEYVVSGNNSVITLGAGASANSASNNDKIPVNTRATLGSAGGGNTITTYGSNDVVSVNDTANNFDLIVTNASIVGGTAASGETSRIYFGANSQLNLSGSGNTITTSGTNNVMMPASTAAPMWSPGPTTRSAL